MYDECVCVLRFRWWWATHSKSKMKFNWNNKKHRHTHTHAHTPLTNAIQWRWNCVMKISHTLHASLLKKGQHKSMDGIQRDLKNETKIPNTPSTVFFAEKNVLLFDFMFAVAAVVLSFSVRSISFCFWLPCLYRLQISGIWVNRALAHLGHRSHTHRVWCVVHKLKRKYRVRVNMQLPLQHRQYTIYSLFVIRFPFGDIFQPAATASQTKTTTTTAAALLPDRGMLLGYTYLLLLHTQRDTDSIQNEKKRIKPSTKWGKMVCVSKHTFCVPFANVWVVYVCDSQIILE